MSSLYILASTPDLFASPTGLNNIPTADVVPEKVLVLQSWANFGRNQPATYYSGFKYGPLKGVEIGLDGKVGTKNTGPTTFQFKCQLHLLAKTLAGEDSKLGEALFGEDSKFMSLVGVENLSTSDRAGEVNPYTVFTYDLKLFRAHLGYNFQDDNDGVFAGADKTLKLFKRELILRTDLKQTEDGHDVLGSLGFLYLLPGNFILESWVSIPSASNLDETFTTKLNYVIEF